MPGTVLLLSAADDTIDRVFGASIASTPLTGNIDHTLQSMPGTVLVLSAADDTMIGCLVHPSPAHLLLETLTILSDECPAQYFGFVLPSRHGWRHWCIHRQHTSILKH